MLQTHSFEARRFEPNIPPNLIDECQRFDHTRLFMVNRRRADLELTLEWYEVATMDSQAKNLHPLPTEGNNSTSAQDSHPIISAIIDVLTDERKSRLVWQMGAHGRKSAFRHFKQVYEPSSEYGAIRWLILAARLSWDPSVEDEVTG
jgi:hypothetical protein